MHLTRIISAKKVGFKASSLYPRKELPRQTLHYLKHKSSFFVAVLSLVAFVAGNMVGEHGWYAFWKSVMGKYDDSLIAYTGTVPPIAYVPDYEKWSTYGGNAEQHVYRQVPQDALVPLPVYSQATERHSTSPGEGSDVYSVGNMGSYETGAEDEGSHPGVDIRVPKGTPVRSIANGIVEQVREDSGGYGLFIVIRHPHAPDPADTSKTTVLHSIYGHLSAQLVAVGDVVQKGQEIALSGQTGYATGPHLHFQVDRDEAPWHPYWPFTTQEAKDAGYTFTQAINKGLHQERLKEFTLHPMLYVQANYSPVPKTTNALSNSSASSKSSVSSISPVASVKTVVMNTQTKEQLLRQQAASLRELRIQRRLSLRKYSPTVTSTIPTVVQQTTVASATPDVSPAPVSAAGSVKNVVITHDGSTSGRTWETISIRLVDENGNTVNADTLKKDIVLGTAYGEAEFQPRVLTALDFRNGVAIVKMLPRGNRTVVISVQPYGTLSSPMRYVAQ